MIEEQGPPEQGCIVNVDRKHIDLAVVSECMDITRQKLVYFTQFEEI